MILLDDRVGAIELLPYFRPYGDLRVESTRLEFGDACWPGQGPDGECMVGLERKRISDLVQSIRSHRLAGHQLPGLCTTYAYVYLLVEGIYRPGPHGELEESCGKGWRSLGVSYLEIHQHLSTLEQLGSIVVRRSAYPNESAAIIAGLYKWWAKPWTAHRSHKQIYCPTPANLQSRKVGFISPEETIRRKYGDPAVLVWRMAAQLPGLDTKAEAVAEYFRRPSAMFAATVVEWQQIKGIGKHLATRYVEAFR